MTTRWGRALVAIALAMCASVSDVGPTSARTVGSGFTTLDQSQPQTEDFRMVRNPERNEYLLAYHEVTDPISNDVFVIRIGADGQKLSGPTVVASDINMAELSRADFTPAISYNPVTDQYLVTYTRARIDIDSRSIAYGRLIDDLGSPVGPEQRIIAPLDGGEFCTPRNVESAFDKTTGGYTIAFVSEGRDCTAHTADQQITYLQSLGGDMAIGNRVALPATPDGGLGRVDIEANAVTDTFLVVEDATTSSGLAHVVNSDLSVATTTPLVTTSASPGFSRPLVAADPVTGNWLVLFFDIGGVGSTSAVLDRSGNIVRPPTFIFDGSVDYGLDAVGDGSYIAIRQNSDLVHIGPDGKALAFEDLETELPIGGNSTVAGNGSATAPGVVAVGPTAATGGARSVVRSVIAPGTLPLVPARLADTRSGPGFTTIDGQFQGIGKRTAGSVLELSVAGRGGVPSDAEAVMLNVAAAVSPIPGFVTAFPCDAPTRPNTSNLNYPGGGAASAAGIAKISATGTVCFFTSSDVHLIIDVNGHVPAGGSVDPLVPARLLDTRPGTTTVDGQSQAIGRVAAGSTTELQVSSRGGVAADADAALVNVTAINPDDRTFLTVYPCGTLPTAANLNAPRFGIVNNLALAKIGPGGKICVFSSASTDLVVDVTAFVPANGGLISTVPARFFETRRNTGNVPIDGEVEIGRPVEPGSDTAVRIPGRGAVPLNARGVMLNVAAIIPETNGFMTVYPCDQPRPNAANVNFSAGSVVSNAVFVKIDDDGRICVYSTSRSDLAIDVVGYTIDG